MERKLESWGCKIEHVLGVLGGPQRVIEELMGLMALSFAAKVVTPFATLASRIGAATVATCGLAAAQAELGGAGLLRRLGIAGLGGLAAHEGLNFIDPQDALGAGLTATSPAPRRWITLPASSA